MQGLSQPDWQHTWSREEMERELAPFQFTGPGWYITAVPSKKPIPHDPVARDTLLIVDSSDGTFQVSCWNRHGIKEEMAAILNLPIREPDNTMEGCPTPLECFGGQHVCAKKAPVLPSSTFKGIPLQHVEWALKVYKLATSGVRWPNASLERTFPKGEAEAKEYFSRTQNVWNARVRAGEAAAFEVVLGVQDARKHRKKGSFREVDRAVCTGQVT